MVNCEYDKTEDLANMLLNRIETHCNVLSVEKFYMKHNNHGFDESLFLYLASVKFPEFENAKAEAGDIAVDTDDLILYAQFPVTGKIFLEWENGKKRDPESVKPVTLHELVKTDA